MSVVVSDGLVDRFRAGVGSGRLEAEGGDPDQTCPGACLWSYKDWVEQWFGSQKRWAQTLQMRELRLTERKNDFFTLTPSNRQKHQNQHLEKNFIFKIFLKH